MVTPEMLLWLAERMGLPKSNIHEYRQEVCYEPRDGVWLIFNPATDDAQFGRLVVWAHINGVRLIDAGVEYIAKSRASGYREYSCIIDNLKSRDSIRAAAVVAICRALGWEGEK